MLQIHHCINANCCIWVFSKYCMVYHGKYKHMATCNNVTKSTQFTLNSCFIIQVNDIYMHALHTLNSCFIIQVNDIYMHALQSHATDVGHTCAVHNDV